MRVVSAQVPPRTLWGSTPSGIHRRWRSSAGSAADRRRPSSPARPVPPDPAGYTSWFEQPRVAPASQCHDSAPCVGARASDPRRSVDRRRRSAVAGCRSRAARAGSGPVVAPPRNCPVRGPHPRDGPRRRGGDRGTRAGRGQPSAVSANAVPQGGAGLRRPPRTLDRSPGRARPPEEQSRRRAARPSGDGRARGRRGERDHTAPPGLRRRGDVAA
jgi:hypothetical protein